MTNGADTHSDHAQRIARLTPLSDALALLDAVTPVAARMVRLEDADGLVLAADVTAPRAPDRPVALLDGWAVRAEETQDAGGYAPAPLSGQPQRVDSGDDLPAGTDTVAPLDTIGFSAAGAEALTPFAAGEGVLPPGGDCTDGAVLRHAGEWLRNCDLAVLTIAGIERVSVRMPRIAIAPAKRDRIADAIVEMIACDIPRLGGEPWIGQTGEIDAVLRLEDADAVVIVGGTGSGRDDGSVVALADVGRVAVHGIALAPGETTAAGFVGNRPVLLVPGRLDAALAAWLTMGRRMLERLCAATAEEPESRAALARKVTSTVGVADVIPVTREGDTVRPLAAKYLPLSVLARAEGWILVPADSEGYPAGAAVTVKAWL